MFTIRQLDFDEADRRCRVSNGGAGVSTCMIVGVVVIVFYLMSLSSPTATRRPISYNQYMHSGVRGMRGIVSRAVDQVRKTSARTSAIAIAESPGALVVPATNVYPSVSNSNVLLLQMIPAEGTRLSGPDKTLCKERLKHTLASLETVIVMIFASWCQHCHNQMPMLGDLEERHVVMVDGDCLPADILSGNDSITSFTVEYFPTFAVYKNGKLHRTNSLAEAKDMYDETGADNATSAARVRIRQNDTHRLVVEDDSQRSREYPENAASTDVNLSFMDDLF